MGMTKTEVIEKYPVLEQYKKDRTFMITAYHILIDKITEGLNIEDCKILAKEKLDFSLVSALSLIDDFKRGASTVNYKLDEAINIIDYALIELKKFFCTPRTNHRISKTTMIIRRKKEVSKVIWLMTGFYIYPESWTHLVNEVVEDKAVYIKFCYTEKGVGRFVRVNLHEYKIYKKQPLRLKIINENTEKEIINIVNTHFGFFKISCVFATEKVGDRLIIYPTRNRKEKVEMNLFEFEDQQKILGV
jgi:hypothetical protein